MCDFALSLDYGTHKPDGHIEIKGAAMKVSKIGELGLLKTIRQFTDKNQYVEIGFGDDAAVLKLGRGKERVVVTTDMLVEGIHFSFDYFKPAVLGRRAYEVNASDIAAMGALPVAAFISIGIPPDIEMSVLRRFYRGFSDRAKRHSCVVVGGDTVRAECFTISVTILGRLEKRAQPLLRSAALPGQRIFLTGLPGESGMGLKLLREKQDAHRDKISRALIHRHLLPEARIVEGLALAKSLRNVAAIDVSDGVFNELNLIARASGVRLNVEAGRLPLSPFLKTQAERFGIDPLEMVLFGGEDYELLFTASATLHRVQDILERAGSKVKVHEIGRVARGRGVRILDENGKSLKLKDKTFRHFLNQSS